MNNDVVLVPILLETCLVKNSILQSHNNAINGLLSALKDLGYLEIEKIHDENMFREICVLLRNSSRPEIYEEPIAEKNVLAKTEKNVSIEFEINSIVKIENTTIDKWIENEDDEDVQIHPLYLVATFIHNVISKFV
jgi:hypothetical protein